MKLVYSIYWVLGAAHTLKCYQCNSLTDPGCENLEHEKPHNIMQYFKECVGQQYENKSSVLCRKKDLLVYQAGTYEVEARRTIRSCGFERSSTPCYRADNDEHLEIVCECYADGCNASTNLQHFSLALCSLVAVAVITVKQLIFS